MASGFRLSSSLNSAEEQWLRNFKKSARQCGDTRWEHIRWHEWLPAGLLEGPSCFAVLHAEKAHASDCHRTISCSPFQCFLKCQVCREDFFHHPANHSPTQTNHNNRKLWRISRWGDKWGQFEFHSTLNSIMIHYYTFLSHNGIVALWVTVVFWGNLCWTI